MREIRFKVPCIPHDWAEYKRRRFHVLDSGVPGKFKIRIFERCCRCGRGRLRDVDEVTV